MPPVDPSAAPQAADASPEQIFTHIFHANEWGSAESRSGPGAELRQTVKVREAVAEVIREHAVRSVFDAGCGDFNWQPHVPGLDALDWYLGVDVVHEVVELNRHRRGGANLVFAQMDITREHMPPADLVISRDCMVHLSNAHVVAVLQGVAASGSGYLLATTYPAVASNRDTNGGHWRPLNLCVAPFNLPPPITFFDTDFQDNGRNHPGNGLGLWAVPTIPVAMIGATPQGDDND